MHTTRDTLTGKPFRWDTTVYYAGKIVPARYTTRRALFLHPDRVPVQLLERLNAEDNHAHGNT